MSTMHVKDREYDTAELSQRRQRNGTWAVIHAGKIVEYVCEPLQGVTVKRRWF